MAGSRKVETRPSREPRLRGPESARRERSLADEALPALAYCLAFVGYLFVHQEGELEHWMSLVLLPLGLLYAYHWYTSGRRSLTATLASVGLKRGSITAGLLWSAPLALVLSLILQFAFSRSSEAFLQLVTSGRIVYMLPIALLLLLSTVAFTQEFFFRGVLQTRLTALFRSRALAVVVVALLFGFYHLPYAYFNPHWPSHGEWSSAIVAALSNGMAGGLVLGAIYAWSGNNLVSAVIAHALIDLFPAMTMIRFG